jgi:hypothetical protein
MASHAVKKPCLFWQVILGRIESLISKALAPSQHLTPAQHQKTDPHISKSVRRKVNYRHTRSGHRKLLSSVLCCSREPSLSGLSYGVLTSSMESLHALRPAYPQHSDARDRGMTWATRTNLRHTESTWSLWRLKYPVSYMTLSFTYACRSSMPAQANPSIRDWRVHCHPAPYARLGLCQSIHCALSKLKLASVLNIFV